VKFYILISLCSISLVCGHTEVPSTHVIPDWKDVRLSTLHNGIPQSLKDLIASYEQIEKTDPSKAPERITLLNAISAQAAEENLSDLSVRAKKKALYLEKLLKINVWPQIGAGTLSYLGKGHGKDAYADEVLMHLDPAHRDNDALNKQHEEWLKDVSNNEKTPSFFWWLEGKNEDFYKTLIDAELDDSHPYKKVLLDKQGYDKNHDYYSLPKKERKVVFQRNGQAFLGNQPLEGEYIYTIDEKGFFILR
jgi:hypothetical protein